jgi:hypothetical protein
MYGHGLRGELGEMHRSQPAFMPQWVVRCPMARGRDQDLDVVPLQQAFDHARVASVRQ